MVPPREAVTVNSVLASSSPTPVGLTVRVIPEMASSSSSIVVMTDEVPKDVVPPPSEGLDIVTLNVSPDSSKVSSVVWTVKV